jgi:hypothetical protein
MEGGAEDGLEGRTFKVVAKRDELKGGHKGVGFMEKSLSKSLKGTVFKGGAIDQAVSRRIPTPVARVQS